MTDLDIAYKLLDVVVSAYHDHLAEGATDPLVAASSMLEDADSVGHFLEDLGANFEETDRGLTIARHLIATLRA